MAGTEDREHSNNSFQKTLTVLLSLLIYKILVDDKLKIEDSTLDQSLCESLVEDQTFFLVM